MSCSATKLTALAKTAHGPESLNPKPGSRRAAGNAEQDRNNREPLFLVSPLRTLRPCVKTALKRPRPSAYSLPNTGQNRSTPNRDHAEPQRTQSKAEQGRNNREPLSLVSPLRTLRPYVKTALNRPRPSPYSLPNTGQSRSTLNRAHAEPQRTQSKTEITESHSSLFPLCEPCGPA